MQKGGKHAQTTIFIPIFLWFWGSFSDYLDHYEGEIVTTEALWPVNPTLTKLLAPWWCADYAAYSAKIAEQNQQYGNHIKKRGLRLPTQKAHTDFVFSIVVRKSVLWSYFNSSPCSFLILRIILVVQRAKGIHLILWWLWGGGMILMQTFVNIGGISGLIQPV